MSIGANDRILRALADLRQDPSYPSREAPARSLARAMREYATPAASITVIDDFQVVWSGGFGMRKAGGGEEASSTTLFQAGSISKAVFALAVVKLAERGHLDLDEDVNRYLTSWQVPTNNGWTPRITLRQLLSHTAGTTVHGFAGYRSAGPMPGLIQILRGEAPANNSAIEVDLLPGTQFRYSGGGTTIAQQAIVDLALHLRFDRQPAIALARKAAKSFPPQPSTCACSSQGQAPAHLLPCGPSRAGLRWIVRASIASVRFTSRLRDCEGTLSPCDTPRPGPAEYSARFARTRASSRRATTSGSAARRNR